MDPVRTSLPDGRAMIIRRLTVDDAPALVDGFAALSEESRRLRFLTAKPRLSAAELRYFTDVDGHDHEALAAVDPVTEHGIGIARFVRDRADPTRAEVAVTVADDWQHHGVGTLLLNQLTDRARAEGVLRFTALVSSENEAMHGLLGHVGGPVVIHHPGGAADEYEIDLAPEGLPEPLVGALRGVAAGRLAAPAGLNRILRALVPFRPPVDPRPPPAP